MIEASDESVRRPSFINVGTIAMIFVMVVGGFWLRPVMATRNLNSLVASTNADLPRMLDAGTRLDRLTGSSEGVVYHLTVMGEADFTEIRPRLEAQTRMAYCERMDGVVNDGFSAEWRYSTQEGRSLGSVIMSLPTVVSGGFRRQHAIAAFAKRLTEIGRVGRSRKSA